MKIYLLYSIAIIIIVCFITVVFRFTSNKRLLKIAHRGASGYEPENTLRSFQKAIELGADAIEFDVHRCKSGEIIVIHDESVDSATNGSGLVSEKTLNQLHQLDAGKGEKIPTLEQVLDLVNKKILVDIELKGDETAKPVADIIKNYVNHEGWSFDSFCVTSFKDDLLTEFRRHCDQVKIGLIVEAIPQGLIARAQTLGASYIINDKDVVTKSFVDTAHKNNIKVGVYTVNEPIDITNVKKLGIDAIISDYPDRLSKK